MNGATVRWGVMLVGAAFLPACGGAGTDGSTSRTMGATAAAAGDPMPPEPRASSDRPTILSTTIYELRRPGTIVAAGTTVALEGPAIQVTAAGGGRVWIQEAGGSKTCEDGGDALAYRAITVTLPNDAEIPAIGDRVAIEGAVSDDGGTRSILATSVTSLGPVAERYLPMCQRSAHVLQDVRFDAVLVTTAGEATVVDGEASLATCFDAPSGAAIAISPELHPWQAAADGWMAITGVVAASRSLTLFPRVDADFYVAGGNDVCL